MYNIHYIASAIVMFLGLFILVLDKDYYRKIIGLSIFQSAIILLYVSSAYVVDSFIPILAKESVDGLADHELYTNPLPQVLMLTAIVVGIATTALGLALVHRYYKASDAI